MFTGYFAVFALGRLAASWVQTKIRPSTHLQVHLAGAALCLAGAVALKGMAAAVAVTAIGFFVSILFPTLYSIAIKNMGDRTGQVSGLLTMGFVGCALIPVLQGRLADSVGLQRSYAIGFAAYLFASWYAFRYRELKGPHEDHQTATVRIAGQCASGSLGEPGAAHRTDR